MLEGVVYERRPGSAASWVRVTLEAGRVVLEGHDYRYALEASAHVLAGVTRSLRGLSPEGLMTGRATLGPVGVRALERLNGPRTAA